MSDTAVLMPTPTRLPERGEWLSRKEAAAYLSKRGCPISAKTLANMAANGNARRGPPFSRIAWSRVQYRRTDLDVWMGAAMVTVA